MGGIAIVCGNRGLHAESPTEIYQRLVIPLIQSAKSSSCSECHLQAVKLDDFLTSDPKASFASLRARGWIDTKQPAESKLLEPIRLRHTHASVDWNALLACCDLQLYLGMYCLCLSRKLVIMTLLGIQWLSQCEICALRTAMAYHVHRERPCALVNFLVANGVMQLFRE